MNLLRKSYLIVLGGSLRLNAI